LTGRENIYLNGAILGMRRQEIERRFQDIVDFSGVERFLDTPVKRFSSGMYMRLAFAVAAHLDPEILLVDEVLAVGDAAFQRKCLNKMDAVASAGRTVLFVSHNMRAISALCTRAVLLEHGRLVLDGPPIDVVKAYLQSSEERIATPLAERSDRSGGRELRFTDARFYSGDDEMPTATPLSGEEVRIALCCENTGQHTLDDVSLSIGFFTVDGTYLFGCRSSAVGSLFSLPPGMSSVSCHVPRWPLNGGRYIFNLKADRQGDTLDWVREAGILDVEAGDYFGTGDVPMARRPGVLVDNHWSASVETRSAVPDTPASTAPARDEQLGR
jgi:lipopolysaccharide transport system ATP-binding protein